MHRRRNDVSGCSDRAEEADPAAIEQVTGCYYARIEAFNDEPQTTHAVVIKVLRQAREDILNAAITPRAVEQRVRTLGAARDLS